MLKLFGKETEDYLLKHASGMVDAPIGRDEKDRLRMAVNLRNGRNARTHYIVKDEFTKYFKAFAALRNRGHIR